MMLSEEPKEVINKIPNYYFRYWKQVAVKARREYEKKQMSDGEEFTSESISKILGKNVKHQNAFRGCADIKERNAQLFIWMRLLQEDSETNMYNDDKQSSISFYNPKARSKNGYLVDLAVDNEILTIFSLTNQKLTRNHVRDIFKKFCHLDEFARAVEKVDSRTMWRLVGRSKNPFLMFAALEIHTKKSDSEITLEIKNRVKAHQGKLLEKLEDSPDEVPHLLVMFMCNNFLNVFLWDR